MLALEGPGPVRIYLDSFLSRLRENAEVEYSPWREKFWLKHPELGD